MRDALASFAWASVRAPVVPGAEDLSRELVGVGIRQWLELLHAPVEAIREIEITELIGRDAMRAGKPARLAARRSPAIEKVPVEVELQNAVREGVAGPDETLVVDEVVGDERALARGPVWRAERP